MARKIIKPEGRTAYVPVDSFTTDIDGVPVVFQRDKTRVSEEWLADHPEVRHLFIAAPFHFDLVEQATAAPGEVRG